MNVLSEVCKILAEQTHTPVEQLNAQTKLSALGIESVDVIEILFRLEEQFDIELPLNANEDITAKFETIGSVTKAVEEVILAKNNA